VKGDISLFSNLKGKIFKIVNNIFGLNLCHGKSSRSLNLFGKKMPMCARCFGMLIGVYIFVPIFLIYFLYNPANFYYFVFVPIFLLPGFIDGVTQMMGYRISNNLIRLITGFFIGMGIGLFANLSILLFFDVPHL